MDLNNQTLIDYYGTTTNIAKAGFILSNGQLLDFSDGMKFRVKDHREIYEPFYPNGLELEEQYDFLVEIMCKLNLIRWLPESNSINLIVEPTEAQYKALKNILFKSSTLNFSVEISSKNLTSLANWSYEEIVSTDQVILDIKEYFKNN